MLKKFITIVSFGLCTFLLMSCLSDDTYKLAKKMDEYKQKQTGYSDTLQMAQKGNYDANCKDCFRGMDTTNISLFAFACEVDMDIAKAVYSQGADIEISNEKFPQTPLLAALHGNRNNPDIVYWLIGEGADINVVDYNHSSVFHHLRYWDDNQETRDLIDYFKTHCDMQYLKEQTSGNRFCDWDELWDENGEFNFYS